MDVAAVAGSLPDVDAGNSQRGSTPAVAPSDGRQRRRPDLSDLDDGAKGSFDVAIPPTARNPATAGDAFEKHITRRESDLIIRRLRAVSLGCLSARLCRHLPLDGGAGLGGTTGRTRKSAAWKGLAGICPCRCPGRMPDRHGDLVLAGTSGQRVFPGGPRAEPLHGAAGQARRGISPSLACSSPGLFDTLGDGGSATAVHCLFRRGRSIAAWRPHTAVCRRRISLAACAPDFRRTAGPRPPSPSEVSGQRVVLLIRHGRKGRRGWHSRSNAPRLPGPHEHSWKLTR